MAHTTFGLAAVLALGLATAAMVAPVVAADLGSDTGGWQAGRMMSPACARDHARVCGSGPAHGRQALRCLSENHGALSARCLGHLKLAATIEVCAPDYARFCHGVPVGRGRVLSCLAGNRDRISERCGQALSALAPRLVGRRVAEFGSPRHRDDRRRDFARDDDEPGERGVDRAPPQSYEPPDLSDAPIK